MLLVVLATSATMNESAKFMPSESTKALLGHCTHNVRGRAGATGGPFNLGEMTVTRCSLKLADGTVGHGYVQGRNKQDAEAAALVDALMQTDAARTVRLDVLDPLMTEEADRRATRAAKAAATRVEFFTLVRGDD